MSIKIQNVNVIDDSRNIVNVPNVTELLTADRTYYVSTLGNDDNDGLSVGSPVRLIQTAVDRACIVNAGNHQITIQVADGTYAEGGNTLCLRSSIGSKIPILHGNTMNPENVIINPADPLESCVYVGNASWIISGFEIRGGKRGLLAGFGAKVYFFTGPMRFGLSTFSLIESTGTGTLIQIHTNIAIFGGSTLAMTAHHGGNIILGDSGSVDTFSMEILNTPNFSTGFVASTAMSLVSAFSNYTFTGAATGKKFRVEELSLIRTENQGIDIFPGNEAGYVSSDSLYH